MVSTAGKATGSAASQRAKQMGHTVSSTTRKPVTRATNGKKRLLSACTYTVIQFLKNKKDKRIVALKYSVLMI